MTSSASRFIAAASSAPWRVKKNPDDPPAVTALPDAAYRQGYERLRRHAIRPDPGDEPGHGRAILAHHGLAAWMFAAAEAPRQPPSSPAAPASPPTRLDASTVVVDILLAMIKPQLERTSA